MPSNPKPIEAKKKTKSKKKLSERSLGYFLIAPAMILIFIIAIWPVFQSFYYSMFDLRLNNPVKSEAHTSYSVNLQTYLDNYPFLMNTLDEEIGEASGKTKEELEAIQADLEKIDSELQKDSELKVQYDQVDERLMVMKPVSEDLAVAELNKEVALNFEKTVDETTDRIRELKGDLKNPNDVIGLSSSLSDSIITPNFIGLKHYKENLSDGRMWKAISNTTVFTVISVFAELVIGLAIAILINKAFFGRGLVRATILIPWAIPTAVSAFMWKYLYDGQNGIVAKAFESIGLFDRMTDLLTSSNGAMFSVIFADVWKTTPYMALLLLAGLQTIPSSLYEAAAIDGASKWKQFLKITLPLLKSSILVALLFRTLDAFRVFDLIYVLTGGGPANSTETISILAYKVMFAQTNFGEGSALSVIVFICVAIISMIYIKFLGRDLLNDK
ncbi:carbohydrate ABC transporter permease [Fictibacillus phosphorivorans]|uniref:carbohydrate ABC transporter permease n=1 Tax=Fictibacillus phosphorivorans TaxID=1221500 RepID=UPI002040C894|nr:sugar ABC transporter permease [Fictibacillus phosphorivorans]MCM3717469.1 sugar ABC transporter permease [Fictibacillus phosphorivorans]MCM3775164.1 sugar ABC transporter permease [Fictibacillus phosphorivorans]